MEDFNIRKFLTENKLTINTKRVGKAVMKVQIIR